MASTTYDLKLNISANNQASWELDKVSKQTENLQKQSFQWSKETESSLKKVGATAWIVAGSMIALWKSFVDNAIKIEPVENAYKQLATSVGESADDMMASLRKASVWAVKDYDLMLAANKSMKLWVAKNTEDMTDLMKIARLYGQQFWQDVTKSFDDIVTWLWRWSTQILDNLWIVIKQTEAQELYAKQLWKTADQLTEEEKKQALTNAVLAEWRRVLEEFWEAPKTVQERIDALWVQFDTMKTTLWKALLPVIEKVMDVVTPIIEKVGKWIEDNPKLATTIFWVVTAVSWLIAVFSWIALVLPAIMSGLSLLLSPIGLIIAWITALAVAWATDFGWIREKTQAVIDKITEIVRPRILKFQLWWHENWETVKEILRWLRDAVENIFKAWMDIVSWALEIFFQSIDVLLKIFSWDWEWAWEWIKNIRTTIWETAISVVDDLFGGALDWIADKLVAFGDWFKNKRNQIKTWITGIASAMWEWLKQWMEFWVAIFTWDWEKASNIAQNVMKWLDEALTNIFGEMWTNIKTKVQNWIDIVVGKIQAFKDKVMWIINSIKDAWNDAKDFVGGIGDKVSNTASNIWNGAKNLVGFANGGSVTWWTPIIVWERWPELFVPNSNWTIIPNEEISNNNNVTINMSGITIREDADITRLADEIVRLTKLEKNYWII